jgi:hypothetical protein
MLVDVDKEMIRQQARRDGGELVIDDASFFR